VEPMRAFKNDDAFENRQMTAASHQTAPFDRGARKLARIRLQGESRFDVLSLRHLKPIFCGDCRNSEKLVA
jgi:hypothetical protein